MSYDLMVFAVEAAPRERESFLEWYDQQSEWEEDHGYDDPSVSTAALRAWFMEMIKQFPAMNGPYASREVPEEEAAALTDYSVGRQVIYAAFAWSMAEQAYETVFSLAGKHNVGFFNASGPTGAVWLPDGKGGLTLAHEQAGESSGGV
jgi:AcrR family transcriptional regulator